MAEFTISVIFVSLLFSLSSLTVESEGNINSCDLFDGIWVYDESYPLYESSDCDFIEKQFDCSNNGRPDNFYLKYSWQPSACKLPRFHGEDFLERMRGKSIMFVGDSLSLNQWQSLTCMLHKSVPQSQYTDDRTGLLSTFTFPEYDVKVVMSRNVFLVDVVDENGGRVLKLDSIQAGQFWKQFDVLIFDSWHWWLHAGRRQPWDFIQEGNKTYKDMDRLVAYEKALKTWTNWVDSNVDPSKTKVFFQGVSPDHMDGKEWGEVRAKSCANEERPLEGHKKYPGGSHPTELVVERVLKEMSNPNLVYLLNITTFSQLRKDGHPSVYGHGGHRGMDCTHWCLPGVPDTWNQLLYAALVYQNYHYLI
ncbi:protein trichome birefringence-like 43 isoform X1 [Neltuma alba]|uniref:protein trichome birefringence-like 43 isoform X1 n=1 Tax=Neltuma alba TaxID=207710 RepID=UPI0010A4A1F0|nr:protein trichome birefringence-like 43 isoform X1 [Prosopis alba]